MTDLERVSEALEKFADETGSDFRADAAIAALDAHLKEDAERDRRADEFVNIIQGKLMEQAAELAELRALVQETWRLDVPGLQKQLTELRDAARLAISYCQDGQPEDAVDVLHRQLVEEKE